ARYAYPRMGMWHTNRDSTNTSHPTEEPEGANYLPRTVAGRSSSEMLEPATGSPHRSRCGWVIPRPLLPGFGTAPRCRDPPRRTRPIGQARLTTTPRPARSSRCRGKRQGETMAKGNEARTPDDGGTTAAEPEFVQLLTPDGERVDHPDYSV